MARRPDSVNRHSCPLVSTCPTACNRRSARRASATGTRDSPATWRSAPPVDGAPCNAVATAFSTANPSIVCPPSAIDPAGTSPTVVCALSRTSVPSPSALRNPPSSTDARQSGRTLQRNPWQSHRARELPARRGRRRCRLTTSVPYCMLFGMDIIIHLPPPLFLKVDYDTTHATFRQEQTTTADRHTLAVQGHPVAHAEVEVDLEQLLRTVHHAVQPVDPEIASLLEPTVEVFRRRNDRLRHQVQDETGLYMTTDRLGLDPAWSDVPTARKALEGFTETARDILLLLSTAHAGVPVHGATIAEALDLEDGTRAVAASVRQGFSQVCQTVEQPNPIHTLEVDGDVHYVVALEWATTFQKAERGLVRPLSLSDSDWTLRVLPELLKVLAEHYRYAYPFVGFQALGDELKNRIPGLKLNWRRDLPSALVHLQKVLWEVDPTLPWITGLARTGRDKLAAPVQDLARELQPDLDGDHAVIGNPGVERFIDPDSLDDLISRVVTVLEKE